MHYNVVKTLSGIHIINQHMNRTTIHSIAAGTSLFLRTLQVIDPGLKFAELDLHHRRAGRVSSYHASSANLEVIPHGDYEEALPRNPGLGVKVHCFTTLRSPAEWNFYCEDNQSGFLLRNQDKPTVLDTAATIRKLIFEFNKACEDHPESEEPLLPFSTKLDEVIGAIQDISEVLKKRHGPAQLSRRPIHDGVRNLLRNNGPIFGQEVKSWDWVNQVAPLHVAMQDSKYEPPLAPAEEMTMVQLPLRYTRASAGIVPINLFKVMDGGFILGTDGGLYITAGSHQLLSNLAQQAQMWETFFKRYDDGNTPWFDLPRVMQALADNPEGLHSPYRVVGAEGLTQYGRTAADILVDKANELQAFDETMHPSQGDQVPAVPKDLINWFREDLMPNYELVDFTHGTPMTLAKWDHLQKELGVNHRCTGAAAMEVYQLLQHRTHGPRRLIVHRRGVMDRYNVYAGLDEYLQLESSLATWWSKAQDGLRDGIEPADLMDSMVQQIINAPVPDVIEQLLNVHTDDLFIRLKELWAIANWSAGMIDNVAHLIEAVHPDERRGVILAGIQKMHADAKKFY